MIARDDVKSAMARSSGERTTPERERLAQLRAVSGELLRVHRSLIDVARADHEARNGPLRNPNELLSLLMQDEAFAWLRPLSKLIVEIDELMARDPAPTEAETAELGDRVGALISASDDPAAFGSRYVPLLAVNPEVAMSHAGLRTALADLLR